MVAVAPAVIVPRSTATGSSLVTVPCVVVTDPGTMLVLAGMGSAKATEVAAVLPSLRSVTVY